MHQLPAKRIETFGAIELFENVRWMNREGIGGRYFDDADLAGDFQDDVFVLGHFDIALPSLEVWILVRFAGMKVVLM